VVRGSLIALYTSWPKPHLLPVHAVLTDSAKGHGCETDWRPVESASTFGVHAFRTPDSRGLTDMTPAFDKNYIEASVVLVIPEFSQTLVHASDGRQYAITQSADGVSWSALREGQRVRCLVTRGL